MYPWMRNASFRHATSCCDIRYARFNRADDHAQSHHKKLNLSACGIPGNIATMLGLCTIIMLVELLAKEGDTGETGDVAS
jgi:hypothetical protein